MKRLAALAGKIALAIIAPLLVLGLLEGFTSLLLFFRDARFDLPAVAETRYARYDADLGWVADPNVAIAGMYGPGRDLHTNNRGFRGRAATADSLPRGRRRVICSGDSFTLGYGVGDEATWCALLGSARPELEAVNMGQGGYGLDQAYLWYRRDGAQLAHDVHILAYITDDFRRMQEPRFIGYGKPTLELRGDSVVVANVPARGFSRLTAWAEENRAALRGLRLFQLMARLKSADRARADSLRADSATAAVVAAVIRDLARWHEQRNSRLMVVHLPVRLDHNTGLSATWRARMRATAEREAVTFIDLVEPLRRLPADSVNALFIAWNELQYTGAAGHFNERGNRWVAAQLLPFVSLMATPSARTPAP